MCSAGQIAHSASPQRSLESLEQEICELGAHIEAATCRWLVLLGEFDAREGWASWGTLSCAHWLSWRCSLSPVTARERVRVARRLRELPRVREAFAAGELSYCKVRALARVATPEVEADLVELARNATGAQLEKVVRGYGGALSATLANAERVHETRYLTWSWDDDGSLRLQARLPAEDGALVLAALDAAAEETGESMAERRADALTSLARGEAKPCELVVAVDAATLSRDEVVERSELDGGPAIAPETARRLGCDAALVRILERDGEPLSVGRRTRTIPPALRRALRSRDHGCRFPGCTHTRFIHAHHIRHWARGGPTSLRNLVQLCSYHHRLVHEGGYRVEHTPSRGGGRGQGRGGGLTFRRPDGRVIAAGRIRARGPGVVQQNRASALPIDGDTCRPRFAGDKLDYDLAVQLLCHRIE